MRHALRALMAVGLLAGCGDDHEDSAKEKCETLVATFCEAVTTCAVDEDLLADGYSPRALRRDCEEAVAEGARCRDAREVTRKYDSCLAAASERLDCDESNQSLLVDQSFAVPAACQGVVRY